jgi:CRISPR-associated endonuclease/helicase Cas3
MGKMAGRSVPHPLICHMIDTAVVARACAPLVLGPALLADVRVAFAPLGDAAGWIAFMCGLHDLGKYSPGFQALSVEAAESRLGDVAADDLRFVAPARGVRRTDTPHGLVTAMHVRPMLESWGAVPDVAEQIATALGGHHGFFPSSASVRQARLEKNNHGMEKWRAWRDDLTDVLAGALGLPRPASLPWRRIRLDIDGSLALAALTTVSDWIASDGAVFSSPTDMGDLDGYVRVAERQAGLAVERLELGGWEVPDDTAFTGLFPGEVPRPVQVAAEQAVSGRTGPTMTVVEAPTGEGKSKAALQVSAVLVREQGLAGMYVGMPTQATSNQVYADVRKLVKRHGGRQVVRLIHSGAHTHLAERGLVPTDVGSDSGDSDVAVQEWFIRKKSLLTDLGVGTTDQIVKAAIRSGHFFVRLVALSNKVVVIDEVHSYELYQSTLLDRLLTWLGRLSVSVVLLSATLPAARRAQLVSAWRAGLLRRRPREVDPLPVSVAYPRVTVADRDGVAVAGAGVSAVNADRRVRLEQVRDEDVADWVLARVRDGGCVAVVHNLRKRVEATYASIEERMRELPVEHRPRLVVLTGELPERERREREAWLAEAFGPGGTRPCAVVIGTQVLEHGLDLDYDAMVSDAAPVDLLIQRVGRVHRHDRGGDRGEIELGIAGVVVGSTGPTFPRYLHLVYAPIILLRTWALLRERSVISCPDDVPALVDAVYGATDAVACPAGWEPAWRAGEEGGRRRIERQEHDARVVYLPAPHAATGLQKLSEQPKSSRRTRNGRPSR